MPAETPASRLQRERDEAQALLADGYAQDWIDQAELERRLELAEHAGSVAELRALTHELRPSEPEEPTSTALATVATTDHVGAVFGSVQRVGAWGVARKTQVRALFGAVVLDLREACLPAGDLEIVVEVTLASLEVIVPPGWRIDNRCAAVLGSIEQHASGPPASGPQRVLRLTGKVLLGSLELHERLPGEGPWAARKRRKALSKRSQQRALGSGER